MALYRRALVIYCTIAKYKNHQIVILKYRHNKNKITIGVIVLKKALAFVLLLFVSALCKKEGVSFAFLLFAVNLNVNLSVILCDKNFSLIFNV
jgi:hypothetical protein